jgi:hypothetical protein
MNLKPSALKGSFPIRTTRFPFTQKITNDCRGEKNMEDRIETIGKGSVIQHGKLNNRIYLIKLRQKARVLISWMY